MAARRGVAAVHARVLRAAGGCGCQGRGGPGAARRGLDALPRRSRACLRRRAPKRGISGADSTSRPDPTTAKWNTSSHSVSDQARTAALWNEGPVFHIAADSLGLVRAEPPCPAPGQGAARPGAGAGAAAPARPGGPRRPAPAQVPAAPAFAGAPPNVESRGRIPLPGPTRELPSGIRRHIPYRTRRRRLTCGTRALFSISRRIRSGTNAQNRRARRRDAPQTGLRRPAPGRLPRTGRNAGPAAAQHRAAARSTAPHRPAPPGTAQHRPAKTLNARSAS